MPRRAPDLTTVAATGQRSGPLPATTTRVPVRGTYRGYDIVSMPQPSSGGIVLLDGKPVAMAYSRYTILGSLAGVSFGWAGRVIASFFGAKDEAP